VDNIKMDLREIGWGDIDWIDLAQVRNQWGGYFEHSNERWGSINYVTRRFWSSCTIDGFSRRAQLHEVS
jgi:hypothetical protein